MGGLMRCFRKECTRRKALLRIPRNTAIEVNGDQNLFRCSNLQKQVDGWKKFFRNIKSEIENYVNIRTDDISQNLRIYKRIMPRISHRRYESSNLCLMERTTGKAKKW